MFSVHAIINGCLIIAVLLLDNIKGGYVRAAFFNAKTGTFHCISYLANIALPAVSKGHPPRVKF